MLEDSGRLASVMGHLSTVLTFCVDLLKNGQGGMHFQGQNKYWSILTGLLVANSTVMGHLSKFYHVICRFIENWAGDCIYKVKINIGAF